MWADDAACRGLDPQLFFPEREDNDYGGNIVTKEALKVCADCPVRDQCLEAGIREKYGIWGGLTPRQRRAAYRRLHRGPTRVVNPNPLAPCGTRSAYRRHLAEGEVPCEACKAENNRIAAIAKGQLVS